MGRWHLWQGAEQPNGVPSCQLWSAACCLHGSQTDRQLVKAKASNAFTTSLAVTGTKAQGFACAGTWQSDVQAGVSRMDERRAAVRERRCLGPLREPHASWMLKQDWSTNLNCCTSPKPLMHLPYCILDHTPTALAAIKGSARKASCWHLMTSRCRSWASRRLAPPPAPPHPQPCPSLCPTAPTPHPCSPPPPTLLRPGISARRPRPAAPRACTRPAPRWGRCCGSWRR